MPADATQGLANSWLPFTPNRYFKTRPKVLAKAEGAYYTLADGRRVFDCLSGLWCVPLGHGHPKIAEALAEQIRTLDYATAFQFTSPVTLRLAEKVAALAPDGLNRVFFTNSGSEAADTALKMAIGYHRVRGQGQRTRLIGRERGYHGVGFGGMSVGGMTANRKMFGSVMLPGVDHIRHTHDPAQMAFSRDQPEWGAHLADDLERLVTLHDASTIAAVIVEPMAGSTGVLAPPIGYLERLRAICDQHGILLIFDEVITGFGRMGTAFAAQRFGVTPDLLTFAKGVTNGVIPMGGVIASDAIYDTFMGADAPAHAVEFFHGYTYSGHPMAAAAGVAALDIMQSEDVFARVRELEPILADAVHALKGIPGVLDIRNSGLAAGIDLQGIPGKPGLRAMQCFELALDKGMQIRTTGDTIAVGPPFISTPQEINRMGQVLHDLVRETAV